MRIAESTAHRCVDRRALAEMQRKVAKRGKRHTVLRFILADRGMEAGLGQDPSGFQRAFGWFSRKSTNFTSPFQTHLVIDTHMAVSDTKTVVVDAQTRIADMHQKMLAEQGGASHKDDSARTTCYP